MFVTVEICHEGNCCNCCFFVTFPFKMTDIVSGLGCMLNMVDQTSLSQSFWFFRNGHSTSREFSIKAPWNRYWIGESRISRCLARYVSYVGRSKGAASCHSVVGEGTPVFLSFELSVPFPLHHRERGNSWHQLWGTSLRTWILNKRQLWQKGGHL